MSEKEIKERDIFIFDECYRKNATDPFVLIIKAKDVEEACEIYKSLEKEQNLRPLLAGSAIKIMRSNWFSLSYTSDE